MAIKSVSIRIEEDFSWEKRQRYQIKKNVTSTK
jgi:hypothetical protein